MDLSNRMRVICNVKHRCAIRLKFRDTFSISLSKLLLLAKAGIYSRITTESLVFQSRHLNGAHSISDIKLTCVNIQQDT